MNTYRQLAGNQSKMKKVLEVLSSGYQVNRAADDAAGLAISEKMRMQITGTDVAIKNCKDVSSLLTTAEGGLVEMHDMLNRALELAEQSANGTFDDEIDRAQLQKELDSLRSDIDRIAESTNFNDIDVLHIPHSETAKITGQSVARTIPAVTGERSVSRATMLSARQANAEAAAKPTALALENSAPMMRAASVRAAASVARSTDVTCGDFTISGYDLVENTDYSFSGGVLTIKSDKTITIKNSNANVATTNRIEVDSGVNADIRLDGVNIDVSGQANTAAFKIADDSTGSVTIYLENYGNNVLKSGENCAELQKNGTTGRLKITGDRYSALTAQGGNNGAGIGGGNGEDVSNITIKGGLITAIGGEGKTAIEGSNATSSESAKKAIIVGYIAELTAGTTLENGDVLEVLKGGVLSVKCDVTLEGGTINNSGQLDIDSNRKIINNGSINSFVNNGSIYGTDGGSITGEVLNETGCFYCSLTLSEGQYLDEKGSLRVHDGGITELTAQMLTDNSNTISAGWYIVKGDTAINDRITINGDVHLILANGCDMKALEGIRVNNGGSFTVYNQSNIGGKEGKLTATGKGSN